MLYFVNIYQNDNKAPFLNTASTFESRTSTEPNNNNNKSTTELLTANCDRQQV